MNFLRSVVLFWAIPLSLDPAAAELQNVKVGGGPLRPPDISNATLLVSIESPTIPEQTAIEMLVEEVQARTGITLQQSAEESGPRIEIKRLSKRQDKIGPEGFRLTAEMKRDFPVITIAGADERGVLFGVGAFLRKMEWAPDQLRFPIPFELETTPKYPIRGHQLGYRNRANSWDAWTVEQFDQYIRELIVFGANAIENIPFQDEDASPHMKLSREEMNMRMSEICARYGIEYWVWVPAEFDLSDTAQRDALLARHEELYRTCPRMDGVFFPGGDPGDNPAHLVMPFLKDVAEILRRYHPNAGVWLSLQGFNRDETNSFYEIMERDKPEWFTGVVSGPSSPPIAETRERLAKRYKLRHYPDLTHTIRCQYETPQWDQAFALTLGRECINPEPWRFQAIHNDHAPHTDGFISYSDGVHDDVNKTVWTRASWDPDERIETTLYDYTRFFFGPRQAYGMGSAILELENNWRGPLGQNEAVEGRNRYWTNVGQSDASFTKSWRWQSLELRSNYDLYIQKRQEYERAQELAAYEVLLLAPEIGADQAITIGMKILDRADRESVDPQLRARIEELCDSLYASINLQTSVKKHGASGAERGCILDFVDYPLNNRWWLADEFVKVRTMKSDEEKVARLLELARWENPPGCVYYDDIGNVARSPHVMRRPEGDPLPEPEPSFAWWDNGMSRQRLSWQCYMDWPVGIEYQLPDPKASYVIRMTGYGDSLLKINGQRIQPTLYGKEYGEFKEFPVPREMSERGTFTVTWDRPDERHLNWRQHSRVTEMWLVKTASTGN